MRNLNLKLALAIALALPLSAQAGATATHASNFTPPPAFSWAPASGASVGDAADFWERFDDPGLSALVGRALKANRDLRVAFHRYEAANALLRGARFDQLPTVTAHAAASDLRLSAAEAPGLDREGRDGERYELGARLSWELDLFGRVRQSIAAQRAGTAASAADLQALQVLIAAEVSREYFHARGLQERLRVANGNVASQSETLRLVEAGYRAGRGTEFDISRARAQLSTTRARVPALEAELATTTHRLAVLLGQAPEAALPELAEARALPALPGPMDPGTPGDLLRRRPDVAAAEARLAAATARVGIARADLFPRFTLGGLLGAQAGQAGALLGRDGESRFVALGIDWSFLDFGRVRARLAAAHAEAEGEVASYEQVLLRALQETEDALVRFDRTRAEAQELALAAADSANAARLARVRYEAGAADLFEVLDAERTDLQAQDALVQARARGFEETAALYRALAGGFPGIREEVASGQGYQSVPTM